MKLSRTTRLVAILVAAEVYAIDPLQSQSLRSRQLQSENDHSEMLEDIQNLPEGFNGMIEEGPKGKKEGRKGEFKKNFPGGPQMKEGPQGSRKEEKNGRKGGFNGGFEDGPPAMKEGPKRKKEGRKGDFKKEFPGGPQMKEGPQGSRKEEKNGMQGGFKGGFEGGPPGMKGGRKGNPGMVKEGPEEEKKGVKGGFKEGGFKGGPHGMKGGPKGQPGMMNEGPKEEFKGEFEGGPHGKKGDSKEHPGMMKQGNKGEKKSLKGFEDGPHGMKGNAKRRPGMMKDGHKGHKKSMKGGHKGHKKSTKGGHKGDFGPMEDFEEENPEFIEIDCGVDTTSCTLPNGNEGFFVCREMSSYPFGFEKEEEQDMGRETSLCSSTDRGVEGDKCGCCGDICPEPCTCPCDIQDAFGDVVGEGVLVKISHPYRQEFGDEQVCVTPPRSLAIVGHNRMAECATECISTRVDE